MMQPAQHSSSPKVLEAVSVFLCPLKLPHTEAVQRLEQRWQERVSKDATKLSDDIRLFHDDDWGEEAVVFGTSRTLRATVCPKVAWVSAPGHDWVALALTVCNHQRGRSSQRGWSRLDEGMVKELHITRVKVLDLSITRALEKS